MGREIGRGVDDARAPPSGRHDLAHPAIIPQALSGRRCRHDPRRRHITASSAQRARFERHTAG